MEEYKGISSEQLDLFRQGDEGFLRELVFKYGRRLYLSALKIIKNPEDSEEIASETFAIAFKEREKFNGRSSLYTWLWRICYNLCYHKLQSSKKNRNVFFSFSEIYPDDEDDDNNISNPLEVQNSNSERGYEEDYFNEEKRKILRGILRRAILKLGKEGRRVLILREYFDYSYEEIAVMLNISPGTVMSRLSRARSALKKMIEGDKDFVTLISEDNFSNKPTGRMILPSVTLLVDKK